MTPEGSSSDKVRLRLTDWGVRVFRNNSGVLTDARGVPVRFGLGNESKKINDQLKSSDYIGYTPVLITPEMVGKTVAVFTGIEVKAEGTKIRTDWPRKSREWAQQKFINLVNAAGGLAGFATCANDVDKLIKDFVGRLKR